MRVELCALFFNLRFRFVGQDGDDDDDWAEETTEEAQRRRMDEISDHAKNLTLSEDLEKPLEQRVNLFYSFVKVSFISGSARFKVDVHQFYCMLNDG